MKKLFFLSMILTLSVGAYANQVLAVNDNGNMNSVVKLEKSNFNKTNIEKILVVEIVLGRKSKNCKGFGICDWDIHTENRETGTTATLNSNGELEVTFDISTFSRSDVNTYFSGEYFIMDEDYSLDRDTASKLGKPYTIKAGKYKFEKRGNLYKVRF